MRNTIIYLIGGPGVRKQTIAKEIQKKQTGENSSNSIIFTLTQNKLLR